LKRAVPQSWGTSNGIFKTNKVDEITLCFAEYSLSKSVHLTPDIVEYNAGATAPLYDLIIGKQTLHNIGVVLDFKEKTITIDGILLPMRNIASLQLKPSEGLQTKISRQFFLSGYSQFVHTWKNWVVIWQYHT